VRKLISLDIKKEVISKRESRKSAKYGMGFHVGKIFYAFIMESSIIVFTRERLFMLFMYVRLFMLLLGKVCS